MTKTKKVIYKLVQKKWDKILVLNLLIPICFLVCPWKLKVGALAQGCLMLLLFLVLCCICSTHAQLTPKHAQQFLNEYTTLQWVKICTVLFQLDVYPRKILSNHLICCKSQFGQNLLLVCNCVNTSPTTCLLNLAFDLLLSIVRMVFY